MYEEFTLRGIKDLMEDVLKFFAKVRRFCENLDKQMKSRYLFSIKAHDYKTEIKVMNAKRYFMFPRGWKESIRFCNENIEIYLEVEDNG